MNTPSSSERVFRQDDGVERVADDIPPSLGRSKRKITMTDIAK